MIEARQSAGGADERAALIHREIFQLAALIVLAVAAFFLTRAIAVNSRQMTLRDAAEWSGRGQLAMQAGRTDEAITALRRAASRNRDDKHYALGLAQALAATHDDDGARSVLVSLRESDPEDRDVNLQLARLAATRQDLTEALRFYHNALYAPWPSEMANVRRAVRIELVRFLLSRQQAARAAAELLALSPDMPDELALRLEVAQLFADSGDPTHALDQFERALRLDASNRAAIAGAGLAAFNLGNYPRAHALLERLPPDAADVRDTRELVDLLLSRDPLATRIGSAERRQRLTDNVRYVQLRIQACIEGGNHSESSAALADEARTFALQLGKKGALEQDTVEAGVDLIERLEVEIGARCGATTPLDRALALIGRRHAAEAK